MPRPCSICTHLRRDQIDSDIVRGEPFRRIATQRGVTEQAVRRHAATHLPAALVKAQDAGELVRASTLLDELRGLHARVLAILTTAESEGDLRAATGAIREARSTIELLAKLTGQLEERPEINVVLSPEWVTIRVAILEALEPFPVARAAVGERLLSSKKSASGGFARHSAVCLEWGSGPTNAASGCRCAACAINPTDDTDRDAHRRLWPPSRSGGRPVARCSDSGPDTRRKPPSTSNVDPVR